MKNLILLPILISIVACGTPRPSSSPSITENDRLKAEIERLKSELEAQSNYLKTFDGMIVVNPAATKHYSRAVNELCDRDCGEEDYAQTLILVRAYSDCSDFLKGNLDVKCFRSATQTLEKQYHVTLD